MLTVASVFRIFFISFLALTTFAQTEEFRKIEITDAFRNTFTKKAENIHTIQSDFKQEKYISYLDASVVSEGLFYFKKPSTVRWEFTSPYQYVIIIKEGAFHIHDTKGELNFKNKDNEFFDHMNILVQNSLSGNVFSENRYEINLMESNSKYKLVIIPIEEKTKSLIDKVEIVLHQQTFHAESINIYEPSGDITKIAFINRRYNENINARFFE